MSRQPISRSPDLKRLRDEGYDVAVQSSLLLVRDVPYVNAAREVKRGTFVSELNLAGDVTTTPGTHVIHFAGEYPCRADGSPIETIRHASGRNQIAEGVMVDHAFSNKPAAGYANYYEKLKRYIDIVSAPAMALDETATPLTFPVVGPEEDGHSVFNYMDTATSRAQIGVANAKLAVGKVAIAGVGGTGAYVLDLVAKTPVPEIHLFDGDVFSQHNAFRAPGAPSVDELRARPKKVDHFRAIYSKMHRNIVAHAFFLDAANVGELESMAFVFLCLDRGAAKKAVVEFLQTRGIPFVDVGMGVELVDGSLGGILRVTSSTAGASEHVTRRITFGEGADGDYARNIQVADLNALNAALAVIRWKKVLGFYRDYEREHHATYTIDTAMLLNEDAA